MKRLIGVLMALAMLVALQVAPAFAADEFQVNYQQMDVAAGSGTVSGLVVLNVINTSGGDVTEVSVALAGTNNILYGTQPVFVGDIANADQIQIGVPFAADAEAGAPEAEATWVITFTDASGASQAVAVTGTLVE